MMLRISASSSVFAPQLKSQLVVLCRHDARRSTFTPLCLEPLAQPLPAGERHQRAPKIERSLGDPADELPECLAEVPHACGVRALLTPEQMVDLNRTTLRVYDGCTSGDERFTAGSFFQQLDASR
jgi:hypothetical protein